MQISLFQEPEIKQNSHINGLTYLPDFITKEEEGFLLGKIDEQVWLYDLKRRVQHYGYKYDYKARFVSYDQKIGEIPDWIEKYCRRLQQKGLFKKEPEQVIINEYQAGQGISPHIDCVPCFGETIASLSLGSQCVMEFSKDGNKQDLLLEPCSLLVMKDEARYEWQHSIPARKSDKINGIAIPRARRVSMTFRNMILK